MNVVEPPVPGPDTFDAESLTADLDSLLATVADGQEEAELLEQAHRLITDALEGR